MSDSVIDPFRIEVRDEDGRAVVYVHGDLDAVTAPRLESMVWSLERGGRDTIIVDVGYVRTMDSAGLVSLAALSERLADVGVTLTVRAAPPITRRIFNLNRSTTPVEFTPGPPAQVPGGAAPASIANPTDSEDTDDVPAGVVAAVGLHGGVEIVDAALRLVTTLAQATLDHADGVSITIERHGQLITVAASNDTVLQMDQHQYATGEGPCLSARVDRAPYYIPSLNDETRWPTFVPLALKQGIHSILSSPLLAGDEPQGALNIYSTTHNAFDEHVQELAVLFATQASDVLTRADANANDKQLVRQRTVSLQARTTITLAQGVLIHHHHITARDAHTIMRHSSRAAGLTMLQYARQLLSPYTTTDDPGTPPPEGVHRG